MLRSNFLIAALVAMFLGFVTPVAKAAPVSECSDTSLGTVCTMKLLSNLTLEYLAEQSDTTNPDRTELVGTVTLVTPSMRMPLYESHLVIALSDEQMPELYGVAKLPLDQLPVLKDANIERVPLMTIGLMQGDTITELLGKPLPLNTEVAFDGSQRPSNAPYLMFFADAGLALNVDLGGASTNGGELNLTVPGSTAVTFIFDISDPYFYLAYDATDGIGSESDAKDKSSDNDEGGMPIDALGFSTHGWIGYEAQTTYGLPAHAQEFASQLYMHGTVPLGGAVSLTGDVYNYVRENGFAIGGNGDVSVGMPGLPAGIDLEFYLGSASAAFIVSDDVQTAYFSGELSPDTSILDGILPLKPSVGVKAAGFIDDQLVDSTISLQGNFGLEMSLFSQIIGLPLNDLELTQVNGQIDMQGVHIVGTTRTQIHPSLALSGDVLVEAQVDWLNPQAFSIKMIGNVDVFGVGLDNAFIELNKTGLFVNGAFVTPLTSIGLSGSITQAGPLLTGMASVDLGLGGITQAMADATAALTAAQAEVNRINALIPIMRDVVRKERQESLNKLATAQKALTAAKNAVDSLNKQIASQNALIKKRKNEIASWKRWLNKAKWYQKASRAARYAYEAGWRNAEIAARKATILGLKASLVIAKASLDAAKATVALLEATIDVFPIDLDPRVAVLISSKEVALLALEAAKLPFKNVPVIDGDFSGDIYVTLDITGIHGTVQAQFEGYSLLEGSVVFDPVPKACVFFTGLGNACTPF